MEIDFSRLCSYKYINEVYLANNDVLNIKQHRVIYINKTYCYISVSGCDDLIKVSIRSIITDELSIYDNISDNHTTRIFTFIKRANIIDACRRRVNNLRRNHLLQKIDTIENYLHRYTTEKDTLVNELLKLEEGDDDGRSKESNEN